jgi:cytochrome c oxidase subunit 2
MELHSPVVSPRGVYWVPAGRYERIWIGIAFVWCLILFAMMPLWHLRGGQNPTGIRGKVDPNQYFLRTQEFIQAYKVAEEKGIPVVEPPPGADVYLLAQMWRWSPILRLKEGVEYTLHLSSLDLNHGFSLQPGNINIQVVPGYDYALRIIPHKSGEYFIVCNEFCGIGHHLMVGKVEVRENPQTSLNR